MLLLLRCRQHQLNTVFLIDAGSAGIVVQCQNIGFFGNLLDFVNHAAAGDVIRQAAEGLSTDNIGVAAMHQLQSVASLRPYCCRSR